MNTFKFDKSRFLLILIFIVATALIFFLMGLTYKHLRTLSEDNELVYHSMEINMKLEKVYADLKDIETERRNYLLTGDPNSVTYVKSRIAEINSLTGNLARLLQDNPEQVKNMATLKKFISYKYKIVNAAFSSQYSTAEPELLKENLLAGRNVMASITNQISNMLQEENMLLQKRRDEFIFTQKSTPVYLYIISLFSLGMLGFAFHKINKDLTVQREINKNLQLALESANLAEQVGNYGIWTYNSQNKFTYSDNLYRLLGFSPNAFNPNEDLGVFQKIIHPEDQPYLQKNFDKIHQVNDTDTFSYRIYKDSGEERIMKVVTKKTRSKDGSSIVIGTTTDITDEVKNLKNLRTANQELTFYNSSSREAERIGNYGFWRWRSTDDTFQFSENYFKIFGLEPDELPHTLDTFLPFVHPEDLPNVKERIKQMYDGNPHIPPLVHRIIRYNDGKLRYIQTSNKTIDDGNSGNYFLVITQDITDDVLAKQAIQEKNRILEANNKELMAFNYVASHDLQEPLRKIETFISRLRDKDYEKLSENGKQYLDRTQNSAERMRNLITDLLQFSRTTRAEQVFIKTDLNRLMENAIEDLNQKIEEKKADITFEKLPELEVIPFQIQQLFTNLIGNSIKYSREDIKPMVSIRVEKVTAANDPILQKTQHQHYYKFTFTDNGIGFEPEYSQKIFELFNRLHNRANYPGTGIGLAICKKIAENHEGYILANGKPGIGADFIFYLPINRLN